MKIKTKCYDKQGMSKGIMTQHLRTTLYTNTKPSLLFRHSLS